MRLLCSLLVFGFLLMLWLYYLVWFFDCLVLLFVTVAHLRLGCCLVVGGVWSVVGVVVL